MDSNMEQTGNGYDWQNPVDVTFYAMRSHGALLARGATLIESHIIVINSRQFSTTSRCDYTGKESCVNNYEFKHLINLIDFKQGFLTRLRFADVNTSTYINYISTPVMGRLLLNEIDDDCSVYLEALFHQ